MKTLKIFVPQKFLAIQYIRNMHPHKDAFKKYTTSIFNYALLRLAAM